MPRNPEASGAGKQSPSAASSATSSATSLEVGRSLPPTLPTVFEAVERDSERKCNVDTDKPYSVFISRDKWLIVIFASFAALFRQVGTLACFVFD